MDTNTPNQGLKSDLLLHCSQQASSCNGTDVKDGERDGQTGNKSLKTETGRTAIDPEEFLNKVVWRFLNYILDGYADRSSPVTQFLQPEALKRQIDFSLGDDSVGNKKLEALLEQIIQYSVKTGHPYFFNQLFGGVDKMALSGAILTEVLNTSSYTFEVAPVCTLMEREIVQKICREYIDFPQGDGIFCPGGSAANMNALSLARYHRYPESKTKGMRALPPVHIYTSKLGHYSWSKAAFFLGFGLDSIISIDTDDAGRMIPSELDKAILSSKSMGFEPLIVNATSGTTVMGAFDPIDDIAQVCRNHGTTGHRIWLHVDAAWGGSVMLSQKLRYKMKGVEMADSLTWDPHKMSGSLLQCSLFITRHVGLLADAHCAKAKYLFQQDKIYDTAYDTGDKSVQCGRKVDSLKLWVQWKAYGTTGMAKRIETCFDTARYLRDRAMAMAGFRLLVAEPECTNICFWYIPECMRDEEESAGWWGKLSKVAPAVKARMQETGSLLVGYQPQGDYVNFFRMVVTSPDSTKADMDYVVTIISTFAEELFKE